MQLIHLPTVTSTMDEAAQRVRSGQGVQCILANEQTAGRGRQGRIWQTFTAPYSMAATFIFQPEIAVPHMPFIAALAVWSAAIQASPHANLSIKWPNDILHNGQKIAGILVETLPTTPITYLVGIGFNLAPPPHVPENFSGSFLSPTPTVSPAQMAENIYTCINNLLGLYSQQGWSPHLHQRYLQNCGTIGTEIVWNRGLPNEIHGLARSLYESGALELVEKDGTVHLIHSGEIMAQRAG